MKPALPMVLGSGPLADAMRRQIEADPDRYRPMTISTQPVGVCPCCDREVFRVRSRATQFEEGCATGLDDDAVVHPRMNDAAEPDPKGERFGCCCVAPNWGRKHDEQLEPKPPKRTRRRR